MSCTLTGPGLFVVFVHTIVFDKDRFLTYTSMGCVFFPLKKWSLGSKPQFCSRIGERFLDFSFARKNRGRTNAMAEISFQSSSLIDDLIVARPTFSLTIYIYIKKKWCFLCDLKEIPCFCKIWSYMRLIVIRENLFYSLVIIYMCFCQVQCDYFC